VVQRWRSRVGSKVQVKVQQVVVQSRCRAGQSRCRAGAKQEQSRSRAVAAELQVEVQSFSTFDSAGAEEVLQRAEAVQSA